MTAPPLLFVLLAWTLLALTPLGLAAISSPANAASAALPTVYEPPGEESSGKLPPGDLDRLVAPFALYPDEVLADVLAASTFPDQIVAAEHAAENGHGPQERALDGTATASGSDDSVTALLPFAPVLRMLARDPALTARLGRAFLAQQADVLNAVQRLRRRAEEAGTLTGGTHAVLVHEGADIAIQPPTDRHVFVPVYDAPCAFGADAGCVEDQGSVGWDDGVVLPDDYLPWGVVDWGRRSIADARFRQGRSASGNSSAAWRGARPDGEWHHKGGRDAGFARAGAGIGGLTHFSADGAAFGEMRRASTRTARLVPGTAQPPQEVSPPEMGMRSWRITAGRGAFGGRY